MKTLIMSGESLEIHMFVCFIYSVCPYMLVMYYVFPENGSLPPLPVYSGIER